MFHIRPQINRNKHEGYKEDMSFIIKL